MRSWRRQLQESAKLKRCWDAVKNSTDVRPGYYSAQGKVFDIADVSVARTAKELRYNAVCAAADEPWTEVAEIALLYQVLNKPQDRGFITLYISTLDQRVLKVESGFMRGF